MFHAKHADGPAPIWTLGGGDASFQQGSIVYFYLNQALGPIHCLFHAARSDETRPSTGAEMRIITWFLP